MESAINLRQESRLLALLILALAPIMSAASANPPSTGASPPPRAEATAAASQPKHDFRELRIRLKGATLAQVAAALGKPAHVYTIGSSESWEYDNAAYDPVTSVSIRRLVIWFRDGREEYMNATF